METAAQTQENAPAEIKKWSWGAFFLGPIWGIFNGVWISLLGFIPLVGFVMMIVLGLKGNEWAWQNKEWRDVEHFQKVQRAWGWWGFGVFPSQPGGFRYDDVLHVKCCSHADRSVTGKSKGPNPHPEAPRAFPHKYETITSNICLKIMNITRCVVFHLSLY